MSAARPRFSPRALVLGVLAAVAALLLFAFPTRFPVLFDDDFTILVQSWTWPTTVAHFWVPFNEHTMPLGRLTTWLEVVLADWPTRLPLVNWQGPVMLVVVMGLVYLFVGRELEHRFYGLVAMILFGVSLKYNQVVTWFAASFALLALATILLALLAAQRWRQTGWGRYLLLSAFWSALAPGWFASGILAGPFCTLYLLPRDGDAPSPWRRRVLAGVPLLGTVGFLAASLPFNASRILYAEHYRGRSAWQSFDPLLGLVNTARTLVDRLVLGSFFAVRNTTCPWPLVPVVLLVFVLAGWWWWRHAPRRRLLLLGLGFIFVSYVLIYSVRADWDYDEQMRFWTRYDLFPWLGLVFFVCGGLPWRNGRLFHLLPDGQLSRGQFFSLGGLIVLLLGLNFVPSVVGYLERPSAAMQQGVVLRRIEEVDRVCRAQGIAADAARRVLDPIAIPHSGVPPRIDGWQLLRGSAAPRPLREDEVRQMLNP